MNTFFHFFWRIHLVCVIAVVSDTSRPQSVAYTKAVYGVKVDPHFDHRLASFHEVSAWFLCWGADRFL